MSNIPSFASPRYLFIAGIVYLRSPAAGAAENTCSLRLCQIGVFDVVALYGRENEGCWFAIYLIVCAIRPDMRLGQEKDSSRAMAHLFVRSTDTLFDRLLRIRSGRR